MASLSVVPVSSCARLRQDHASHYDIRAYEAKTKLTLQELAPQLSLAVVNGSGPKLSTLVQVEFVAPNDAVVDAVFTSQSVQVIKHLNIKV